jgi:Ubiquinone biosynthesis protein COQ7
VEYATVRQQTESLKNFVHILRLAYSGELAAALAYRGHWHSLKNPDDRSHVFKIEQEEWHHRNLVLEMLRKMGYGPNIIREVRAFCIGSILALLCHISGWLLPMYAAGKLESKNIKEYELAARLAAISGHSEFVDCLLTMAEVEWDHEYYFRSCVLRHRWSKRIPIWSSPPARETIRSCFQHEVTTTQRITSILKNSNT